MFCPAHERAPSKSWLPRDLTDDQQLRQQWIDNNNLTYLDARLIATFQNQDHYFRRDSWNSRGSPNWEG
eukprot:scaffold14475_cov107-Isochrysis_galbana.AAC.9